MEHSNGDLEDDFPFQLGVFCCSMLIFRGVLSSTPVITCNEIPVHLCHCETSLDMLMVQKSGEPPPEIETKNPVNNG